MTAVRQPLLRPDQAAAAVVLADAGSSAERIAEVLAVPVEAVARSLRLPEPAEPPPPAELRVHGRVLVVGPRLSVRHLLRPVTWRAPVFVEDDPSWPPAPAKGNRWQVVAVSEGAKVSRQALREVELWGDRVLVDGERRVFCPVCKRLVGVVELGRNLFHGEDGLSNGGIPSHALGLPSGGAA